MSIADLSGQIMFAVSSKHIFWFNHCSNLVNSGSRKQTDTNKSSDIIQFLAVHLEQAGAFDISREGMGREVKEWKSLLE
jgi:hypothetical protein